VWELLQNLLSSQRNHYAEPGEELQDVPVMKDYKRILPILLMTDIIINNAVGRCFISAANEEKRKLCRWRSFCVIGEKDHVDW